MVCVRLSSTVSLKTNLFLNWVTALKIPNFLVPRGRLQLMQMLYHMSTHFMTGGP